MRSLRLMIAFTAALALAACGDSNTQSFQGWIEADLIFVGPDENGRIEVLKIREGDTVSKAAPLFSLEADLQKADDAGGRCLGAKRAALPLRAPSNLRKPIPVHKKHSMTRRPHCAKPRRG